MRDSPNTLNLVGGKPKPPRPGVDDEPILADAAIRFAASLCGKGKWFGESEAFAEDLLSCGVNAHDDGYEAARKLTRAGYHVDGEVVEDLNGWADHARAARDDAVRRWVSVWRPEPAFEGLARVRTHRAPGGGFAYRTPRYDAEALCLVVGDERNRSDNGAYVVPWEDLTEVSPPTGEDVARYEAKMASEREWRLSGLKAEYRREAQARRRAEVGVAAKAFASLGAEAVRGALVDGARRVADAVADGANVGDVPSWPAVIAAMDLLSDLADEAESRCRLREVEASSVTERGT